MANDDLNQRVTEAITGQLVLLMPEEEIRRRVDQAIETFFSPQVDKYGNRSPAQFTTMVQKALETKSTEIISALLKSDDWSVKVDENLQPILGKSIQAAMGYSPNVFRDIVSKSIAAGFTMDVVQSLQRAMYANNQHNAANQFSQEINALINSRMGGV